MFDLDLMPEWLATSALNSRQSRQLEDLGVTREGIDRAGGLSWSRVTDIGGRCYSPSPAGDVMLIQPVWAGPAPSIFQAVEHPVLFDLIAWRPEDPTQWYYRIGDHGGVLGAYHLDLAHAEDLPISFAITPLIWLQGNCRGAVLLDICEAHWRALREAEQDEATAAWWGGEAA